MDICLGHEGIHKFVELTGVIQVFEAIAGSIKVILWLVKFSSLGKLPGPLPLEHCVEMLFVASVVFSILLEIAIVFRIINL